MNCNDSIPVFILLLNKNYLKNAILSLNWDNGIAKCIIMDVETETFVVYEDKRIPLIPYGKINDALSMDDEKTFWLIYGHKVEVTETWKMAKFLINCGVKRERIINFSTDFHLHRKWIGNLRWAAKNSVDFFATGISYTEVGLELSCIQGLKGINLACSSADLRNNLATAKYVFNHQQEQSCKFVIIGLAPYSFHFDNRKAFSVSPKDVQFSLVFNSWDGTFPALHSLLGPFFQREVDSITEMDADPDFESTKCQRSIMVEDIVNWETELKYHAKKFIPEIFEENVHLLEEYIDLCHTNGAFPVVVIWPFSPIIRDKYPKEILSLFRLTLGQMMKYKHFLVLDLFSQQLPYDCFYDLTHLNRKGAEIVSKQVNYWLHRKGVISS